MSRSKQAIPLPPEIFREILNHLACSATYMRDLLACSLVCRAWHEEVRLLVQMLPGKRRRMRLYNLVVLGDRGVGKSRLLYELCMNPDAFGYRKQAYIDDEPSVLDIHDFSGLEEYTAVRDQWIRHADGILIVYSISRRSTFECVEMLRRQITRAKDVEKVPLMLIGNKCDNETEREVSWEEGYAMACQLGCGFLETSAMRCINIEQSFYTLVRIIRDEREKKCTFKHWRAKKEKKKHKSKCNIL